MKLPELTIYDMPKAGSVTRWHSVNTLRKPSIASHQWAVKIFSVHLARKIVKSALTVENLFAMSEYASFHDVSEIAVGDCNSKLKQYVRVLCGGKNPISEVEDLVAPWVKEMRDNLKEKAPELLLIVKLADLADALVFISLEGIGDHSRVVETRLENMLKEKIVEAQETYPQYDWQEAVVFITKLLERDEQAQIAFESGTNGEKGSDEKFTELFGEVAWTSDK